jgi:hypothetical protein
VTGEQTNRQLQDLESVLNAFGMFEIWLHIINGNVTLLVPIQCIKYDISVYLGFIGDLRGARGTHRHGERLLLGFLTFGLFQLMLKALHEMHVLLMVVNEMTKSLEANKVIQALLEARGSGSGEMLRFATLAREEL